MKIVTFYSDHLNRHVTVPAADRVAQEDACPDCGESFRDLLVWNDDDQVACATCGNVYDPLGDDDADDVD